MRQLIAAAALAASFILSPNASTTGVQPISIQSVQAADKKPAEPAPADVDKAAADLDKKKKDERPCDCTCTNTCKKDEKGATKGK